MSDRDLQAAVLDLLDDEPAQPDNLDAVLTAGRRTVRRRRILTVAGSALVVAVGVAAAALAVFTPDSRSEVAVTTAAPPAASPAPAIPFADSSAPAPAPALATAEEKLDVLERLLYRTLGPDFEVSDVTSREWGGDLSASGGIRDEFGESFVSIDVALSRAASDQFPCGQRCKVTTLSDEPGRRVLLQDTKGDPADGVEAAWLRTVLIDMGQRGFVAASADSDYVLRPVGSPAPLTSDQLLQLALASEDLPATAAALPDPAPSVDVPDNAFTEASAQKVAALERLLRESLSPDHNISQVSGFEQSEGYLTVNGDLDDEYGYTMVLIDVASNSRDLDSFECEQDCQLTTLSKEPGRHVTLRDTKGDPSDPILAERILTVVIDSGERGFVAVSTHSGYDSRPPGSPQALTPKELLQLAEASRELTG